MTGHAAGFMGVDYAPVDGWTWQQVGAYQRGYNAGVADRQTAQRERRLVWREEAGEDAPQ